MVFEEIKIEEAFKLIRNGASIKQSDQAEGIPITRIETIADGIINKRKFGYANIFDNQYSQYYLEEGDILMSHINSTKHLGKVAIYQNKEENVIHGMNLLCLRCHDEIINSQFAYYYFKTPLFKQKLKKVWKKSVNQASFTVSALKAIRISLPSLPDQIKIAHLLQKVEGLMAQRKESIELLDELVKSTFLEMFGDPVYNSQKFPLMKGEEFCNNIMVGVVIKPKSHYVEKGIIALRSLNIKPNNFNLDNVVYFSHEDNENKLSKTKLKTGDVVIVRTGNTGTAAVIPKELNGCNCIDLIIAKPKIDLINPYYLSHFFNSDRGKLLVSGREVGGVQKHFNVSAIRSISIPIPPINLQNRFSEIAAKIKSLKQLSQSSLQELENLFASLSQRAFKGKLDLSKVKIDDLLTTKLNTSLEGKIAFSKDEESYIASRHHSFFGDSPKKTKEKRKREKLTDKELKEIQEVEAQEFLEEMAAEFKAEVEPKRPKISIRNTLGITVAQLADWVKTTYKDKHFTTEMLIFSCKRETEKIPIYFTSKELKENQKVDLSRDLKEIIFQALKGKNEFLQLEQVFYDGEKQNFDLQIRSNDYHFIEGKNAKERSGIYLRIKE